MCKHDIEIIDGEYVCIKCGDIQKKLYLVKETIGVKSAFTEAYDAEKYYYSIVGKMQGFGWSDIDVSIRNVLLNIPKELDWDGIYKYLKSCFLQDYYYFVPVAKGKPLYYRRWMYHDFVQFNKFLERKKKVNIPYCIVKSLEMRGYMLEIPHVPMRQKKSYNKQWEECFKNGYSQAIDQSWNWPGYGTLHCVYKSFANASGGPSTT